MAASAISANMLAVTPSVLSFAGLAVQVWDWLAQAIDEVEYIWRGRFNASKAMYLASRYGLLIAQIVGLAFSTYLERDALPKGFCPSLFTFTTIVAHVAVAQLEIVMLLRVYSHCNRSRNAKTFLTLVLCTSTVLETIADALIVKNIRGSMVNCLPPPTSLAPMICFWLGAGLSQCVAFFTTVGHVVTSSQLGWSRTPTTTLMLRDGGIAFALVFALFIGFTGTEIPRRSEIPLSNAVWSWAVALLSMTSCRMVINMKKIENTRRFARADEEMYGPISSQDDNERLSSS